MKQGFRWLLVVGGTLAVGIGGAISIRVQTWPCGRWDEESSCVARVQLDIQDLNFIPGTGRPSLKAFDLSAGAETVLVGLEGLRRNPSQEGQHHVSILGLFDARNGDLIRILREVEGEPQLYPRSTGYLGDTAFFGVALSPDAQFAASYVHRSLSGDAYEASLIVQRTSDGDVVNQFSQPDPDFGFINDCTIGLGFSSDNQLLECSGVIYQIGDGEGGFLNYNDETPSLSPWGAGGSGPIALDGTKITETSLIQPNGEVFSLPQTLELSDSNFSVFFPAPDSTMFLEAETVFHERGRRRLLSSPFRRLSAITVRSADDAAVEQAFFTNDRLWTLAWSRDSQYFALIGVDLSVQVFRSPSSPNE